MYDSLEDRGFLFETTPSNLRYEFFSSLDWTLNIRIKRQDFKKSLHLGSCSEYDKMMQKIRRANFESSLQRGGLKLEGNDKNNSSLNLSNFI